MQPSWDWICCVVVVSHFPKYSMIIVTDATTPFCNLWWALCKSLQMSCKPEQFCASLSNSLQFWAILLFSVYYHLQCSKIILVSTYKPFQACLSQCKFMQVNQFYTAFKDWKYIQSCWRVKINHLRSMKEQKESIIPALDFKIS